MKGVDTKELLLQYVGTPEEERGALTPKQGEILKRVISVMTLMDRHRVKRNVVDLHIGLTEMKFGKRIDRATAYRDIEIAEYIQGDLDKINRKFERVAMANWQKEAMNRALELDDMRAFNGGMANLIKIQGLDREDPIEFDPSKVNPVRPIFGFFTELFDGIEMPETPEELEREIEALKAPAKFRKKTAEYVDFEDISE